MVNAIDLKSIAERLTGSIPVSGNHVRACSSMVEQPAHNRFVTGSSPVRPTTDRG